MMGGTIGQTAREANNIEGQPNQLPDVNRLFKDLIREIKKISKNGWRIADTDSPWLSAGNAARYCDYSVDHFKDLAKRYEIPTYGERNNQFSTIDLDRWMEEPKCFKSNPLRAGRRRTGEFKIKDMVQNLEADSDADLGSDWVLIGSGLTDE